jgi:hypothetical protein
MGLAPGTLVTFNPTEGSSAVRILVLQMIEFIFLNLNIKACSDESATTASGGESVS